MLWGSNFSIPEIHPEPFKKCLLGPSRVSDFVGLGWDPELANLKTFQVPQVILRVTP